MDNSTLASQESQETRDRALDSGWDREEQLRKNQKAMKFLQAMIDRNQSRKPTDEDWEFWRRVYETIDRYRPVGQKLFSEE
ncbi:MAG: hypothetical protein AB4290_24815 [Spirulina sp.]